MAGKRSSAHLTWTIRDCPIPSAEKLTLIMMATRARPVGTVWMLWPSKETIAWDCGRTVPTVETALRNLKRMKIIQAKVNGGHRSNTFTINYDLLEEMAEKSNTERSAAKLKAELDAYAGGEQDETQDTEDGDAI